MKFPQTTATQIYKNCESIGKYGCLAFCYLYAIGIECDDEAEYIKLVDNAIKTGLLDKDCTVLDAEKFIQHFSGRKCVVTKKKIDTIENIKEFTPVNYCYNGKNHWVVVQNGKIVFNSLMNSLCVTKGKPTECRIIKLA